MKLDGRSNRLCCTSTVCIMACNSVVSASSGILCSILRILLGRVGVVWCVISASTHCCDVELLFLCLLIAIC